MHTVCLNHLCVLQNTNNNGPRMLSCGIPLNTSDQVKNSPMTPICCFLLQSMSFIHDVNFRFMLYEL